MCYILVSTPDEKERNQIKQVVRKDFFNATLLQDAWTMAETVAIAGKVHVDILILSISNEAEDPFYWTAEVMKKQPNIKLILIDETKNFDNLHRSLRCGAIDYLVRPLSKQELQHSIHRSILSLNQISYCTILRQRSLIISLNKSIRSLNTSISTIKSRSP